MSRVETKMRNAVLHRDENESLYITAEIQNASRFTLNDDPKTVEDVDWNSRITSWYPMTFVRADFVQILADRAAALAKPEPE